MVMRWLRAAQKHNFTASQFAIFHPGGSLGRKLLLTVGSIMHKGEENPTVLADTKVQDALFVITDKGLVLYPLLMRTALCRACLPTVISAAV